MIEWTLTSRVKEWGERTNKGDCDEVFSKVGKKLRVHSNGSVENSVPKGNSQM